MEPEVVGAIITGLAAVGAAVVGAVIAARRSDSARPSVLTRSVRSPRRYGDHRERSCDLRYPGRVPLLDSLGQMADYNGFGFMGQRRPERLATKRLQKFPVVFQLPAWRWVPRRRGSTGTVYVIRDGRKFGDTERVCVRRAGIHWAFAAYVPGTAIQQFPDGGVLE